MQQQVATTRLPVRLMASLDGCMAPVARLALFALGVQLVSLALAVMNSSDLEAKSTNVSSPLSSARALANKSEFSSSLGASMSSDTSSSTRP